MADRQLAMPDKLASFAVAVGWAKPPAEGCMTPVVFVGAHPDAWVIATGEAAGVDISAPSHRA